MVETVFGRVLLARIWAAGMNEKASARERRVGVSRVNGGGEVGGGIMLCLGICGCVYCVEEVAY